MNGRRRLVGQMVGLALPALEGGAGPRPAAPAASDAELIRELVAAFARAWNSGDVASLAEVYCEPHLDLNEPDPQQSREETTRRLGGFHASRESRIEITSDEVVVLGDWALQRGEFVLTHRLRSGGPESVERRRYVEVLRREQGEGWRVLWGIDGPLAAAR